MSRSLASTSVMLVIQNGLGQLAIQPRHKRGSIALRINAESTFVSRMIIYRSRPTARTGYVIPAGLLSVPLLRSALRYATQALVVAGSLPSVRCAGCDGFPLPRCAHCAWRGVSSAISHHLPDDEQ